MSGEVVGYQRRGRRVGSHDWNAWLPCSADDFNQIGANRTIGGFELESRALVLATDYAALLEKLESSRETNAALVRGRCQMDDEIAALQAKLDAVTKDAERYRWLRDMANDISESAPMVVRCDHTFDVSWRDALYGNALDAAIDEAADLTDQGRAGEGAGG